MSVEDGDDDDVIPGEEVDGFEVDAVDDVAVAEGEEAFLLAVVANQAPCTGDVGAIHRGWHVGERTWAVFLGLEEGVLERISNATMLILQIPEFLQLATAHRGNNADLSSETVRDKKAASSSINRDDRVGAVQIELGRKLRHWDSEVDDGVVVPFQRRDEANHSVLDVGVGNG